MTNKLIRKGRLNGAQRQNLRKLLNMEYTPQELADIVDFSRRQVYRVYQKNHDDFPCRVDETKHLWINGREFREWYHRTYLPIEPKENEIFCLTCYACVEIVNPTYQTKGEFHSLLSD